jgi:MarR family transcriptional regulator, temperature-dependent positive regulator of motility
MSAMERRSGATDATGAQPKARDLRSVVFHLLRRVIQEHTAQWQARVPELTKPQYAVLHAVLWEPGIDQAAAGQRAATDKATLAALLARMEQRGLIERVTDPGDRRRRRLYLTDTGRQALERLTPVADGIGQHLLDRLTGAEQDELRRLLRKLAPEDDPSA